MNDRSNTRKPFPFGHSRHVASGIAGCLAALSIVAALSACGGGGGGSAPVVDPSDMRDPPAAELPELPLQRAQDAANSPVLHVGRNLHVGADVAPPPDTLRQSARHADIAVSHGTLADGIGAGELIEYLEHDTALSIYSIDDVIPGIGATTPTVRIARGTTSSMRDEAIRAIQLINAALPRDWQIRVDATPGVPGAAPPTNSDFLIQFLPRENWPDGWGGSNAVGVAGNQSKMGFVDGQYQIISKSVHILVDHTRTTGRGRMDILVHEIIHGLERHHPDPELFPHTIMLSPVQSRDAHILYPLDREALLAWYSWLRHGFTVASLAEDLGPWSDTSTHLLGEFSAAGRDVSFGVALRNGLAQPWATGPAPLTDLADNSGISGTASWSGRLLGFTPSAEPVAGAADLSIALDSLDGDLDFTGLEYWSAGQAPGAAGSGTTWSDGDLSYDVEVRGNTFTRTAGDAGIVTGAFLGTWHQAMGGTLQRDDLSAAFGGSR